MKKAIALLATLVVLTSTVFAQLAPTITASAETKWGVNLDAMDGTDEVNATGFENSVDIEVIVPLTTEGAMTEGSHSSIALTGVELTIKIDGDDTDFDTKENGDIEAKLLFGDAYVKLGDNKGYGFNYAENDEDYIDIHAKNFEGWAGISLGYATDMFSFEANVNSVLGYDNGDKEGDEITFEESDFYKEVKEKDITGTDGYNSENLYNYGVKFGLTPMDMFNLDVTFATRNEAKDIAFGAKVNGTIMEGLTYAIPMDYLSLDTNGVSMELHPSVDYTANGITVGAGFYQLTMDKDAAVKVTKVDVGTVTGDLTMTGSPLSAELTISKLDVTVGYGTDMFNASLKTELNITEDKDAQKFTLTGDVTPVAGVKVYTEASYEMANNAGTSDKTAAALELAKIGVTLTSEITNIENVAFTAEYGGLKRATYDGEAVDASDEDGKFFIGAKISL